MNLRYLLAVAAAALALTGCPFIGANCPTGQSSCSVDGESVCRDLQSDADHCGACGNACGDGFVCSEGACVCGPGSTACGGACVATVNDPSNCGSCGNACPTGLVCSSGACTATCGAEETQCGLSCVNLGDDEANCGACGHACEDATSCHDGSCQYDLVAACSTNGQVVGIQAGTDLVGPTRSVGPNRPMAIASLRDVLLVTDYDRVMSQVRRSDLVEVAERVSLGDDPRFVLSDDPFVYVVNSITGTLQIFEAGGPSDGGILLTQRSELPLSASDQGNTYAQGVVKSGHTLYIPLQGGFGDIGSVEKTGQKVLRVDVTDPAQPVRDGSIDLMGLELNSFDGGANLPRPADAVLHRGALYVALANWDSNYKSNGPPLLAKINLETGNVTTVDVGADVCLGATELVSDGEHLFVSCLGNPEYASTTPYEIIRTDRSALAVIGPDDTRLTHWTPGGCQDGDEEGCLLAIPSRFAVHGSDIYVGDQNGGRLFVLELQADGGISERRGLNVPAGPLQACPVDPARKVSNVIDVISLP